MPISNRPQQPQIQADSRLSQQPQVPAGSRIWRLGFWESYIPTASGPSRQQGRRSKVAGGPGPSRQQATSRSLLLSATGRFAAWKGTLCKVLGRQQVGRGPAAAPAQHCAPAACQTHQVDQDGVAKAQPGSFKELIQQLLHRQHARLSAKWVLTQQRAAGSDHICWCQMLGCCCALGILFSAHQADCWSTRHLQTQGL